MTFPAAPGTAVGTALNSLQRAHPERRMPGASAPSTRNSFLVGGIVGLAVLAGLAITDPGAATEPARGSASACATALASATVQNVFNAVTECASVAEFQSAYVAATGATASQATLALTTACGSPDASAVVAGSVLCGEARASR